MWPAVRNAFPSWSVDKEGRVPFFYLDRLGLVTIGVGNLMDDTVSMTPPEYALALPMVWKEGGKPASRAQKLAEWVRVKSRQDMAPLGGGRFREITHLKLLEEDIDRLVFSKLDSDWKVMCGWLPDLPNWPADGQLAMCSMAWALGPRFDLKYPRFTASARLGNFRACSEECSMKGGGTIVKRNKQNRQLFLNAAVAKEKLLYDPAALHFPEALAVRLDGSDEDPTPPMDVRQLGTVIAVQERLNAFGIDPGPLDGKMGPKTVAAIMTFQRARALVVDGLVGPKTRAELAKG
jgi:hypothetical protein